MEYRVTNLHQAKANQCESCGPVGEDFFDDFQGLTGLYMGYFSLFQLIDICEDLARVCFIIGSYFFDSLKIGLEINFLGK